MLTNICTVTAWRHQPSIPIQHMTYHSSWKEHVHRLTSMHAVVQFMGYLTPYFLLKALSVKKLKSLRRTFLKRLKWPTMQRHLQGARANREGTTWHVRYSVRRWQDKPHVAIFQLKVMVVVSLVTIWERGERSEEIHSCNSATASISGPKLHEYRCN